MRDDLGVLIRLLRLFRPYRAWMALGALASAITVLANVGLMAMAGWFITSMALAGAAGALMNYFTPAAAIRLLAILRTGGRYVERLVTHEATFRLLAELRVWFFRRLEPLAPARLERYRGADLLARIQTDIDTLHHAYLRLLVPILVAVLASAVVTSVLTLYSVSVALLVLALLAVTGVAIPLIVQRAGRQPGAALVETRTALRTAVVDAVQGMAELSVYGGRARAAAQIASLTQRLIAEQRRLAGLAAFSESAVVLCASLAMWGATLLAVTLVRRAALEPAELPMLALAVLASFEAVGPLPLAFQKLGETVAAARRVFELVDAEPPVVAPPGPSPAPLDFGIGMHGVRLRYDPQGAWALDGLDLDIASGARVAIVGPTGAGKSSIVRLLLRFWEYQAGEVRLGGHDLRSYRHEDLRQMICVISQDTYLFNATVLENLRIANPGADEATVVSAAKTAQIHDFVASLPDGYHTWVGEAGVRLSAGQARRVAIARALLSDAPILLLDEPTESLDPPTERALLADLASLMTGRTVVLVTHNLAVLHALVDEVLVLEAGRITARGSHSRLLEAGGYYARCHDLLAEPAAAE